ncbi:hypothetical protein SAMN04488057_11038 [Cyclobacterium lianum]|uniref:Uncharacterized protein n=1 Tax=Cyclobacterium lianum TaxID=388280 RepID=A0A1M7PR82_9BACT|nr:hypothetical protein [Cyclobacterium lianum]SHN19778.1 hypothetical protein SAMN04488057_11038 [Cyclobacterium lianum]
MTEKETTSQIQSGAADLADLLQLPDIPRVRDRQGLVEAILPLISQMLNRDFEKLLQLCYRLDLGEQKLQEILTESPPEDVSHNLSSAIVDRQLLKIYFRNKYR